jgi:hypothetical protein
LDRQACRKTLALQGRSTQERLIFLLVENLPEIIE